jgi:hypothetical protein
LFVVGLMGHFSDYHEQLSGKPERIMKNGLGQEA